MFEKLPLREFKTKMRKLLQTICLGYLVVASFFGVRMGVAQEDTQLLPPANQKKLRSSVDVSSSDYGVPGDFSNSEREVTPIAKPSTALDIDRLVTELALDNMPHTYADDRKWGMQDERWDGLHIRREGWQIKTKRRKKKVNHGTWRKYSAQLINPQDDFTVRVSEFTSLPGGKLGFDLHFAASIALQGRQSEWVKGVQLYSLSAQGSAKIRLTLRCELGIDLDFGDFPPDVIFSPVVRSAEIYVDEFKLDRVSKLGGEFAQQMTKATRKILDKKIEEKEAKLVQKINKQIEKKSDRLSISLSECIDSDWTKKAMPHLPASLQAIIQNGR